MKYLLLLLATNVFAITDPTMVKLSASLVSGSTITLQGSSGSLITDTAGSLNTNVTNTLTVNSHAVTQSGLFTVSFSSGSQGFPLYINLSSGSVNTPFYMNFTTTQPVSTVGTMTIVGINQTQMATESTLSTLNGKVTAVNTGAVVISGALPTGTNRMGSVRLVDSSDADLTTTKGVQPTRILATQDIVNSGRQIYIASATAVTPVTSDAVITLSTSANFTPGPGAAGSSFVIPTGKTLRIQGVVPTWRSTAVSQSNGGVIRLRANLSGTCTVASPMLYEVGISCPSVTNVNTGNAVGPNFSPFVPDGIELSGTNQFCISHVEQNTQGAIDISVVGFTY